MAEVLQQFNCTMQGRMRCGRVRLHYTDSGTAVSMGTLPAGTMVTDIYADVEETFDGSGTDLLKVGRTGDDDAYVKTADVDLASAVALFATADMTGDEAFPRVLTEEREIFAQYDDANSDATQGKVTVTVVYGTCGY